MQFARLMIAQIEGTLAHTRRTGDGENEEDSRIQVVQTLVDSLRSPTTR